MKELSIEEKAKCYDKAIEIAKSKIKNDKDHVLYEEDVIEIFPELKVPDDEKIRKELIAVIDDSVLPDEQKERFVAWLEKQGEQKPADKVEPKFKIGDWVVTKYGKVNQVISINKDGDGYTLDDDTYFSGSWCDNYHLWTIEDAKDGDVLRLGCVIAIFKSIFKNSIGNPKCVCYCSFYKDRGFEIPIENGEDNVYGCTNTTPATQEECGLLFQKMKEAGYEWNKDKKKLIKL